MGEAMASALDLPRGAARDKAERLLSSALAEQGLDAV